MTTLNPSHFPFSSSTNRTQGAAVHTAAPPLASRPSQTKRGEDTDDEGVFHKHGKGHERRRRKRSERKEEDMADGLVPIIPIPDLRFEQGYLLSITPFLHLPPHPTSPTSPSGTPSTFDMKTEKQELRVKASEAVAAVEDVTPRDGQPSLYLDKDLRIEWGMVIYVTLRDQFAFPLLQGLAWGTLSPLLMVLWARRAMPLIQKTKAAHPGIPTAKPRGLWERLVGSVLGGIQTNTVLK